MSQFCDFNIIGNLTRDPEVRYTPGGTAIARYTVACNRYRRDKDGNGIEDTSYVMVTTFGKQAENDKKFLAKGCKVAVKGQIVSWYDQAKGKGGYNFEAEAVMYLAKARTGQQAPTDEEGQQQGQAAGFDDDGWLDSYQAEEQRQAAEASRHQRK